MKKILVRIIYIFSIFYGIIGIIVSPFMILGKKRITSNDALIYFILHLILLIIGPIIAYNINKNRIWVYIFLISINSIISLIIFIFFLIMIKSIGLKVFYNFLDQIRFLFGLSFFITPNLFSLFLYKVYKSEKKATASNIG